MIRRILYAALLIAVFFAPVKRVNVADLEPVEAILLTRTAETVTLTTDTDISGTGEDISRAMENLRKNTPGELFLDTVQYVALPDLDDSDQETLKTYLPAGVKFFYLEGQPAENWAEFFRKGDRP